MAIHLMIVEDHALVRAGLRALAAEWPDVVVVAEASSGREALALAERHSPDVVLMDISMPDLNGLDATARLSRLNPRIRTIILSMHAQEEYVHQALQAGARGYLLKDAAPAELEGAIRAVMRGDVYLSPSIAKYVAAGYVSGGRDATGSPLDHLTPRQREVLQLVAEGHSTKDIANALDLSVKTVESHRGEIMRRLDIHGLAGLVRFAIRTGLAEPR
ncbi:MAG: response regulator transcription factor [Vicinamibacterales bacterium]